MADAAAVQQPKKLKPLEVDVFRRQKNPYASIKTLRDILRFKDVPFPMTSDDVLAAQFSNYAQIVSAILAQTLWEFDSASGSLNGKASRRQKTTVAQKLQPTEIEKLKALRDCLRLHLCEQFNSMCRAPPLAGGDTARWSIAAQLYIVVCELNCVLLRFGMGKQGYDAFDPSTSGYLTGNALVMDVGTISTYSVRALQMTVNNALRRLTVLSSYDPALDDFCTYLFYRTSELICGAGSKANGYNAKEWCAPIATAHSGLRSVPGDSKLLTCTTDFITHSMVWHVVLHSNIANYFQLATIPSDSPTPDPARERQSVEQTRQMRWFPNERLTFRVFEFFCEYARSCADDTYIHGVRDFCTQFEVSPDHATLYRVINNTDVAVPADVITAQMPNASPVGKEFVRLIKYTIPLLEWLHRFWNWRKGETRIRSDYMGNNSFYTQMAFLYVIDLFFSNRTRISFRHRFVMYLNDPAFMFLCAKGTRSGYPFIVQQFGHWSVHIPHRADPMLGTFPVDTTLTARADAAIVRNTYSDALEEDEEPDDDDGESSEVFHPPDRPVEPSAYDWRREVEAIRQADERGEDVGINRAQLYASHIPTDLPDERFCRVYDCETILDAFNVWAIALLHVKSGIIDKTDVSYFICSLFDWPHPKETTAAVDTMLEESATGQDKDDISETDR